MKDRHGVLVLIIVVLLLAATVAVTLRIPRPWAFIALIGLVNAAWFGIEAVVKAALRDITYENAQLAREAEWANKKCDWWHKIADERSAEIIRLQDLGKAG